MAIARINGVDIFYEVAGDGYPVVWSHEFAGDYRSWEPQVRFFSRYYRNVTYSARGWLPSGVPTDPDAYSLDMTVDDLLKLLDHLEIEQAHLAGLSMGANVVLNFALRHPERCRSIVVAGCGTGSSNRERFEQDVKQIIDSLMTGGMDALSSWYTRGPSRTTYMRKDPKGWQEFHNQFLEHSALGSALTWQGVILKRKTIFQRKEELNRLTVPTLLLVGDEDEPCIDAHAFMKREISTAGAVMFPQCGHTVNIEEPTAFNEAVLNFFHLVEAGKWGTRDEVSSSLLPKDRRS